MKTNSLLFRLLLAFLLISPLPLSMMAWLYVENFERMLVQTQLQSLGAIADKKSDQINAYMQERIDHSRRLGRDARVGEILPRMSRLRTRGGINNPAYRAAEHANRAHFNLLLDQGYYHDLLLTDTAGNVVFSLRGEADLGSNLEHGPDRDSLLAQGHRAALRLLGAQITNAGRYTPSNNTPALFIVNPVIVDGRLMGTVALQLNINAMTQVTTDSTGLGLTGETVLTQRSGNNALYINPLRHVPDAAFKRTKLIVDTPPPMQASLRGESGEAITQDYAGNQVVAAWRHLPIVGWSMVVKIDTAEALAPVTTLRHQALLALGILTFIIALLTIAFARNLINPLRQLIRSIHKLRDGDFGQRVTLAGVEEFRQLVISFNEMAMALQTQQEQITGARETAERASAAKSEFLSRMSHELRTPLNAIIGFAQMLVRPGKAPLSAQQADNVQEILKAGKQLLGQVNEVLDLSRIESGRIELSLEPVALAPVMADCIAQLRPLADKRHITIASIDTIDTIPANLAVLADATRLRQILVNLVSNAIKYNRDNGTIRLSVETRGERLRVVVADNGKGIAADKLARLFQPFERLETAYDGIEGTGIGLALVKKLVAAMHGEIGVESEVDAGSRFWFMLPAACLPLFNEEPPAKIGAADDVVSGQSARCFAGNSQTPHTVLYIEDNPANLKLMRKILSGQGHLTLIDAPDAESGLVIAQNRRPDLILLDINLPGMDGFEALRHLKADPSTQDIPVIAVTANAMRSDFERGMAAGFSDYLTKPFDIDLLRSRIDSMLKSRVALHHNGTDTT